MIFDERFSPVVWWADELFEPFLIIRNGVIVDPKPFSFQIFFFFFQIFFFFKMFTLRMTTIFIHFDRISYFDILFFSFRYSFFSKCLHYGWLPYLFILIEFFILIFFFFFQIFFFFSFRYSFFSKCVHYGWLPYLFILTEFFTLIFFFFQNVYITDDYHIYSFW